MLFKTIKEERMKFLGKDSTAFGILGLVVSEIQRTTLSEDVPDDKVVKVIKKLIEGINESLTKGATHSVSDDKIQKLNREFEVLNSFLPEEPTQLTEEELSDIINSAFIDNPSWKSPNGKGALFKFLKENYANQYDGKMVNIIIGKIL